MRLRLFSDLACKFTGLIPHLVTDQLLRRLALIAPLGTAQTTGAFFTSRRLSPGSVGTSPVPTSGRWNAVGPGLFVGGANCCSGLWFGLAACT